LAARVDIADITHVIHFDLPADADTYVHRAGRTVGWGGKAKSYRSLHPIRIRFETTPTNSTLNPSVLDGVSKGEKKDKVMEE
jgi:superfamily II DNA/RNA helicase